jgi:hypothetical protein
VVKKIVSDFTMKILLINPPRSWENKILEYAPDEAKHFIHKKLIGPPLGLLTVAEAVNDYDVTFHEPLSCHPVPHNFGCRDESRSQLAVR